MMPTSNPPRRTILVVEDALTTRCILEQFFAHLLYKRFGYREVVQRLEKIITVQAA